MINGKTIPRPSQKISWIYHNSLGDLQINTLHGDRIAAQHLIWTSCGRRPGYQNSQIQMMQLWGNRRCHKSRLLLQTTSVKTSPAARFHGYANFASWAAHGSFTKVRSPVWRGEVTHTHTHTRRGKNLQTCNNKTENPPSGLGISPLPVSLRNTRYFADIV